MKQWLSRQDIESKKKSYLDNIDPYPEYIEDGSQYRRVLRLNEKYCNLSKFCDNILTNLDKVEKDLQVKGFEGKVEYCMGYFRTLIDGVYKYKKADIVCNN